MKLPIDYECADRATRRLAREQYVREQGGNCSHCGCALSGEPSGEVAQARINRRLFPEGFFTWPIHLHHSHETGMTIGAVHARCNAYLWQYLGE